MSITNKLFIIIIVPMLALAFFGFKKAYVSYKATQENQHFLEEAKVVKSASDLLSSLAMERGLFSLYNSQTNQEYFRKQLDIQEKITDKELDRFSQFDFHDFTAISKEFFLNSVQKLSFIKETRQQTKDSHLSLDESFENYSNLNRELLELINALLLNVHDQHIVVYTIAVQKLIYLQEIAGKERAKVANLLDTDDILAEDRFSIKAYIKKQKREIKYINIILQDDDYAIELAELDEQFTDSWLKRWLLTPKEWFILSTERIMSMHDLNKRIFNHMLTHLEEEQENLKQSSIVDIIMTLLILLTLLFANLYVSYRIEKSVEGLDEGLKDFFRFLHSESYTPTPISVSSNDEIGKMAQNINKEITLIKNDLRDDKDFINEATQIVMLMKDGDFSERPYFEPKNPNLVELKNVLDELMELISSKIKEQTDSLERLNSSLEDKVYEQTLELHNQVQTVTKARDEAIQAQVMKDEFLANMSHEIRTPLNGILGFVAILKRQIKDEKHLEYIRVIDESGKSLLTIINDILDFSKIQSGKFTIDKHPTVVVESMSDVVMLFASKAYEKDLLYATYIDPNLPQLLNLDSTRVKQIVSNLLSNAIKFTQDYGEIKVSVVYKNPHLVVSVGDSGIGISKENQVKVFSAFTQADGSTTRNYGGTGLGLSISANLAELMGGTLSLQSKVGKGSTFTLSIPAEVIEETPLELLDKRYFKNVRFAILNNCVGCGTLLRLINNYLKALGIENIIELDMYTKDGYDVLFFAPEEEYDLEIIEAKIPAIALLKTDHIKLANIEHIQALYAPFIPKAIAAAIHDTGVEKLQKIEEETLKDEEIEFEGSVLIAEDNKTNQMLIKLLLMDYGIDFQLANDGEEAVSIFKEGQFDMVLMDENMPNMNGIEAMAQIKAYEKDNNLEPTPIIALTASALDTDKEMFLNAGMDGFIAKPIDNKILELELAKYLKRV